MDTQEIDHALVAKVTSDDPHHNRCLDRLVRLPDPSTNVVTVTPARAILSRVRLIWSQNSHDG